MARRLFPDLRRMLSSGIEGKSLSERTRSSSSAYVTPGQPYNSDWSVQRAVDEAYRPNPLVFRAIEVICENAVDKRIVLRQGDQNEGQIISDPRRDPSRLLHVLNRQANPWETAMIFRHRMVAQFFLSSRGVFIEVVRTRGGRIGLLHLLDPDQCSIVPAEKRDASGRVLFADPIGGLQFRKSDGGFDYLPRFDPAADATTQPSAFVWLRNPHPTVMWQGVSATEAAGLSIDLDKYARLYNRRFLQNDGRPGGIIAIKGQADRDVKERLQAQFTGGIESAGRTTVIQADAISYADTSGSPRDLMWGELSGLTRKEIAMAFGVPESVLGDASGRTFDNADAEYAMFWEHRMRPLLRALDNQLEVLTGGYDDDLWLQHDLRGVWVLNRHRREEASSAAADVDAGRRTINEYRELAGLETFDAAAADVLLIPSGKVIGTGDENLREQAAASPMMGAPQPADVGAEAEQGAATGSRIGVRQAENVNNARSLRLVAGDERGGGGGFERRSEIEPTEAEGKQGGARDESRPGGEWG